MKTTILITRYFGLFILVVGVLLNIKMFYLGESPTYMFSILCFFGVVLIGISYLMKPKA